MLNWYVIPACLLIACAVQLGARCADNAVEIASLREAFGHSRYADTMRQRWAAYYQTNDSGKTLRGGVPYYPTEPGIILLSAWLCTGDEKYREASILQFEFAHSRENDDALLITELGFNRDTQARQIYNFYTAYKILGDRKYLSWADKCARGLLDHLPRIPHKVLHTELTYNLFAAGYCKPEKPYDTSALAPWVDVNQNAELALAYTQLYFDPESAFYKSATAKDIADNEMDAGVAMQDPKTGAIPIGDSDYWLTRCDTMYGSYGLFSWTWLNMYWKNPDWQKHVEDAGCWLTGFSVEKGKMADRYYPEASTWLTPVDVWCRVPVFHQISFSPVHLMECAYGSDGGCADTKGWEYVPTAYFVLMKIPPEFYLSPSNKP